MKFVLGFLLLGAVSFNAFADLDDEGNVVQDRLFVECKNEYGALNFKFNRSTQVATFTDKTAMGRAELPVDEPIAAVIDEKNLKVTYDWYFTAEYTFTFEKEVRQLMAGDQVSMILDGDDDDGSFFNNERFSCSIK